MTDPVQSGGDAPAAEPNAGVPPSGATQPFGTFSSIRGSGLARGKRSTTPAAASAAPAGTGEYKPTALEVIIPEREYKNPFGGPSAETSAKAEIPVAAAPEPVTAPPPAAPAPVLATQPAAIPVEIEAPRAPAGELFPLELDKATAASETPAKAELNILPPAETKRPALSWESAPAAVSPSHAPVYPARAGRDERPTFRPVPRGDQPRPESREPQPENREVRSPERTPRPDDRGPRREGRDARPDFRDPRREPASTPVSRPAATPKPGGFLGWLKGLFGAKPAPQPAPEARREDRGLEHRDGQHRDGQHRRRRRGGRGRSFGERSGERAGEPGGPSTQSGGGEARFQGGERHGDEHGGHRPRRHRGGRGRSRGDHGGGPRSEGQQGGGHI